MDLSLPPSLPPSRSGGKLLRFLHKQEISSTTSDRRATAPNSLLAPLAQPPSRRSPERKLKSAPQPPPLVAPPAPVPSPQRFGTVTFCRPLPKQSPLCFPHKIHRCHRSPSALLLRLRRGGRGPFQRGESRLRERQVCLRGGEAGRGGNGQHEGGIGRVAPDQPLGQQNDDETYCKFAAQCSFSAHLRFGRSQVPRSLVLMAWYLASQLRFAFWWRVGRHSATHSFIPNSETGDDHASLRMPEEGGHFHNEGRTDGRTVLRSLPYIFRLTVNREGTARLLLCPLPMHCHVQEGGLASKVPSLVKHGLGCWGLHLTK